MKVYNIKLNQLSFVLVNEAYEEEENGPHRVETQNGQTNVFMTFKTTPCRILLGQS